jgi:butyrate kinase
MVNKLVTMIDKEQHTNIELKTTSDTLSHKNEELQQMNTVMVGRELRMTELKKEIEELKKKLSTVPPPPAQ